jgi:hypothetical protein
VAGATTEIISEVLACVCQHCSRVVLYGLVIVLGRRLVVTEAQIV